MEIAMNINNVKGLLEVLDGDTRNTMHSILGFLELISEGQLDPAQREFVGACRIAADGHCRGIEDVRLVLGLIPEEKQAIADFAPGNLLRGVAEVIGVMAKQKGLELISKIAGDVPELVSADAGRIGQAVLRVAEGVVGTSDSGDLHLNLGALASPGGFHLSFEILAPGSILPPVLLLALEQGEFEFDASLSGSDALRMAAARRLATAFAGSLDVSAHASTGTRIVITVPVNEPSGAGQYSPHPTPGSPGAERALRILVAEDSEASFQLFQAYLRGKPHSVARATNGAEAVELASSGAFDLLFMDISMPVMDGYAATRRIRELETGKDRARLPIVVLSAQDLRAQRRKGALVGCSGHLSKPLRKHELLEAIRAYSAVESSIPVSPMGTRSD
jgi:CheY-like chemotaxis protein